jgi:CrcB protein
MREVVALALAGAAGTLGRWALNGWATRALGDRFAYGTLAVNVLGCLLVGVILEVAATGELMSETLRLALAVGFLGAFTTFSTFGLETFRYLEQGAWPLAVTNVLANLCLGLAATWLGFAMTRRILGGG